MCKRCETAADLLATFIENTPVMTEHGNHHGALALLQAGTAMLVATYGPAVADNAFEHALVRAVTTAIKTGHLTIEQALSDEMPPAGKANIETLKAVYAEEGLDVPELDTPVPDLIAVGD